MSTEAPKPVTIKMKVGLNNLFQEAASTCRSPVISLGFNIANGCLNRIAKRAIELNDEAILDELETIGYIKKGD